MVEARDVTRRFGDHEVLKGTSLRLQAGEVHALLGPNGAGKTTLLRILSGVLTPSTGQVTVAGIDVRSGSRQLRQLLGIVPSGDRSFYLRLSGLENLVFFGRMHGMRRRQAVARALSALEDVDLGEAARQSAGTYSHGMQKRLSIARALLASPVVLLVDEATHDLDPVAASTTRGLIKGLADRGTAVVWATQRLDEIRSFADGVTLIANGEVRFQGSVSKLVEHTVPRQHVLRLRDRGHGDLSRRLAEALRGQAGITAAFDNDPERYRLNLEEGVILGEVLAAISALNVEVLACREERSDIEEAFLALTGPGET